MFKDVSQYNISWRDLSAEKEYRQRLSVLHTSSTSGLVISCKSNESNKSVTVKKEIPKLTQIIMTSRSQTKKNNCQQFCRQKHSPDDNLILALRWNSRNTYKYQNHIQSVRICVNTRRIKNIYQFTCQFSNSWEGISRKSGSTRRPENLANEARLQICWTYLPIVSNEH